MFDVSLHMAWMRANRYALASEASNLTAYLESDSQLAALAKHEPYAKDVMRWLALLNDAQKVRVLKSAEAIAALCENGQGTALWHMIQGIQSNESFSEIVCANHAIPKLREALERDKSFSEDVVEHMSGCISQRISSIGLIRLASAGNKFGCPVINDIKARYRMRVDPRGSAQITALSGRQRSASEVRPRPIGTARIISFPPKGPRPF